MRVQTIMGAEHVSGWGRGVGKWPDEAGSAGGGFREVLQSLLGHNTTGLRCSCIRNSCSVAVATG